jgi:multiple sugar transport system ATP-binding protein
MTVFENLSFGLRLRKMQKKKIEEQVERVSEILGIDELLDRKPKALSGGQRQRVAVGRAIVRNPKVFLFDEPLSNLDAKLRVQMRAEISKLHNQLKTTMIYVTHDQIEAMTMGDRIVVLKDGIIHQVDNPSNLYHSPKNKFVASFIGSPPMNFIEGKIIQDKYLLFQAGNLKLEIPSSNQKYLLGYINKEVILGIRPEDIYESEVRLNKKNYVEEMFTVEVIEPMGHEVYLYAKKESYFITARLSNQFKAGFNQNVKLYLDMSKARFFNKDTEEIIKMNGE